MKHWRQLRRIGERSMVGVFLVLNLFRGGAGESTPAIVLHQQVVEGLQAQTPDPSNVQAVFELFFARLPSEVTVYPSENYYYFQMWLGGRQFWGNLRLATGLREKGQVSFAYAEFQDFPGLTTNRLVRSWMPGKAEGLEVASTAPLEWQLTYKGKTSRFHLHALKQQPPQKFALGADEAFVMRTFDESGCQFFLLFNNKRPFFFWVLNEEEPVPDTLDSLGDDLWVGRRTGFVYWTDAGHGNRRVLIAVRRASTQRNDYFDGPFDQLADNDAEQTRVADYIQRAYPITKGRIDKYGYWTNRTDYQRVGLACYGTYEKREDLLEFVKQAKAAPNFLEFVGRAQDSRRSTSATAPKNP